ncbi:MAG: class I SAM-dependent methyltransferase [Anaerolineales bacterium]|nr:class I SAM-dependent methyltransferase [Anaerolineales bacterium]MDW8160938.1 class I SAM-dependent methyltransferase [Anaerolineales bacterium]
MAQTKGFAELHRQYTYQSLWTAQMRDYLLELAGANPNSRILEVGCGTGLIIGDIQRKGKKFCYGIDIDYMSVLFAKTNVLTNLLSAADAQALPFPSDVFDVTVCHYFLMWVQDKNRALQEMIRVTRKGGAIIAFAEPDHRSRIDYPANLEEIGRFQNLSLIHQGADISAGRKLFQLFTSNGLIRTIYGVYGNEIREENSPDEAYLFEWNCLKDDLNPWLDSNQVSKLIEADRQAWRSRQRVLFIPTFWAIGWVPG